MADERPRSLSDSGWPAVLARLVFCAAVFAIVGAVLAPMERVPKLLYSHYLEHFAAFYVATLAGMAAMPRTPIVRIGIGFSLFALALEFGHRLWDPTMAGPRENWVANTGGVAAAVAPVLVDRFRRRFWPN